jgi:CubicO group peptidase (beta-lactamase class C family)
VPLEGRIASLFTRFQGADSAGAAVVVVGHGTVIAEGAWGLADRGRRVPATPRTAFHLASVGKQMTALAVMMLVEEGRLRYDQPAADVLPELAGWGGAVTIRHLLHHTSGLPDTYDALGAIVARVSGQAFGEFMRVRVFAPAGMDDSFAFDEARRHRPGVARGYSHAGRRLVLDDDSSLNLIHGSGSIYSTVEDLARYDRYLFGNRYVKASTLAEAFVPARLTRGREIPYGFGWELGRDHGRPYVGHSGGWMGFASYYLRDPVTATSVIVLSNDADADAESLAFRTASLAR